MVSLTPDYPGQSPVGGGETVHRARWREVLNHLMTHADAALEPVLTYGYGDVPGYDGNPGPKPHQHVQIALTRMTTPFEAPTGSRTRVGWMLETLLVAPTEDEVCAMRDRLHTLRDRLVPFHSGTRLRLNDENNIDHLPGAAGHWGGLTSWRYVTPR